jgi:hypothetical protein
MSEGDVVSDLVQQLKQGRISKAELYGQLTQLYRPSDSDVLDVAEDGEEYIEIDDEFHARSLIPSPIPSELRSHDGPGSTGSPPTSEGEVAFDLARLTREMEETSKMYSLPESSAPRERGGVERGEQPHSYSFTEGVNNMSPAMNATNDSWDGGAQSFSWDRGDSH